MAEQWEMCIFNAGPGHITFVSPKTGRQEYKSKEYINRVNKGINSNDDVLVYLLADGWEPFNIIVGGIFYFRRKIIF